MHERQTESAHSRPPLAVQTCRGCPCWAFAVTFPILHMCANPRNGQPRRHREDDGQQTASAFATLRTLPRSRPLTCARVVSGASACSLSLCTDRPMLPGYEIGRRRSGQNASTFVTFIYCLLFYYYVLSVVILAQRTFINFVAPSVGQKCLTAMWPCVPRMF